MLPLETRKSLIVRLKNEQNDSAWRDFFVRMKVFYSDWFSVRVFPNDMFRM